MSSRLLCPLETVSEGRWLLHVADSCSTGVAGHRYLFGGSGLAAVIGVLEAASCMAALRAEVQFLAPVPVGTSVVFTASAIGAGRRISHYRIEGWHGKQLVLAGSGSAGQGNPPSCSRLQWRKMPSASSPEDCPRVIAHHHAAEDIHGNLDICVAKGRFGIFSREMASADGRVLAWLRPCDGIVDHQALAVMADFVPSTVGNALGVRAGGNSLDNQVRLLQCPETDWVLGEYSIDGLADDIAHGHVHLFAQDGRLMAIGSQTFKVRRIARQDDLK